MLRINLNLSCRTLPERIAKARQDVRTKTTDQNNKEDVVDRLFTQLAAYVESVASDDQRMFQSAGTYTLTQAATASKAPVAQHGPSATTGDHDGEIVLSWDTVAGGKSYVIEKSPDPPTPTSWAHAGVTTKSRMTITTLASGIRYWFRVAPVGTSGQSGWSDPVTKIVP